MEKGFDSTGVFKINNQWATGIQFDAQMVAGGTDLEAVTLRFTNGQRRVMQVKDLSRSEAVELIGEENVTAIEELGKEAEAGTDYKGSLRGDSLQHGEAFTRDYRAELENSVTAGIELDAEQDDSQDVPALKTARNVRQQQTEQLRRQTNMATDRREASIASDKEDDDKQHSLPLEDDIDYATAVPEHLRAKFLAVGDRFYFKDESPAFSDHQNSLKAQSSHHEVVSAMVEIAVARGWEGMTVKGTAEFKKAVWLEARLRGIEVAGFKPSEVDKAHLSERQAKQPRPTEKATPENEVRKGIEKEKSVEASAGSLDEKPKALRRYEGVLLDHGSAKYQHNPDESQSYFVTIRTDNKDRTLWGVDLARTIEEAGVQIGEKVVLDYAGKQAAKVNVKQMDGKGEVIGMAEKEVHRNTWNIERADMFLKQSAAEVLAAHPDLASSVAAVAAVEAAAREGKIVNPDGKQVSSETAQRVVSIARQTAAKAIEQGNPIQGVKVFAPSREQGAEQQEGKEQNKGEPDASRPGRKQERNAETSR